MRKDVATRKDIRPHDLSEPVVGNRVDYWTWVERHAVSATREKLLTLRDHWRECNAGYFSGRMLEPYITLTEPSAPQIYGQCCWASSWGSRLEIRLRPSLLTGTHPHLRGGPPAGRLQFVKDVLLHEMVHQHIMEHQPGVDESSYKGHGPVFTEHCNRIGAQLGLAPVIVRNRKGSKLPKSAQWPHSVAPPDRYLGAYSPRRTRESVTPSIAIPNGYFASCINLTERAGQPVLEINFADESGDRPTVQVYLDPDAACHLADFIAEYFSDDGDGA